MNCWHCGEDIIWGGDHTFGDYGLEGDGMVTNLSCSKCPASYLCYLSDEGIDIEVHSHPLGTGFAQKDNKTSG